VNKFLCFIILAVFSVAPLCLPAAERQPKAYIIGRPENRLEAFFADEIVFSADDLLCRSFGRYSEKKENISFPEWVVANNVDGGSLTYFYTLADIDGSGNSKLLLTTRSSVANTEQQIIVVLDMPIEVFLSKNWSLRELLEYKFDVIDGPFLQCGGKSRDLPEQQLSAVNKKPIFAFFSLTTPFFSEGSVYFVAKAQAISVFMWVTDTAIPITTVVFRYKKGSPNYVCYLTDLK
jgi:hypothetical protein